MEVDDAFSLRKERCPKGMGSMDRKLVYGGLLWSTGLETGEGPGVSPQSTIVMRK